MVDLVTIVSAVVLGACGSALWDICKTTYQNGRFIKGVQRFRLFPAPELQTLSLCYLNKNNEVRSDANNDKGPKFAEPITSSLNGKLNDIDLALLNSKKTKKRQFKLHRFCATSMRTFLRPNIWRCYSYVPAAFVVFTSVSRNLRPRRILSQLS